MATIEEIKDVFADLKKSIEEFYGKYSYLDTNGDMDFDAVLRNCSKMELFLNGDYKELWLMEKEEHRRVLKQLESIPVETYRPRQMSDESIVERRDSCSSMPPLEKIECNTNLCDKTACECIDDEKMPPLVSNWTPIASVNEVITESCSNYVTPSPINGYRPSSPRPIITPKYNPQHLMGNFMRSQLLNSAPRWTSTPNSLYGSLVNNS